MKQGFTYIGVLVDRSGSMANIRESVISGLNKFFQEQKAEPGDCSVRYIDFDDMEYRVVFEVKIADVPVLTQNDFTPRGNTPLYDAQARTINEMGLHFASLPESERPEKVIVVTMTDGYENASREYRGETGLNNLKKLIAQQEKTYGWKFVYLGANQDAVKVGTGMGMQRGSTMTYAANPRGVTVALNATSSYVKSVRSMSVGSKVEFTDADRAASVADSK